MASCGERNVDGARRDRRRSVAEGGSVSWCLEEWMPDRQPAVRAVVVSGPGRRVTAEETLCFPAACYSCVQPEAPVSKSKPREGARWRARAAQPVVPVAPCHVPPNHALAVVEVMPVRQLPTRLLGMFFHADAAAQHQVLSSRSGTSQAASLPSRSDARNSGKSLRERRPVQQRLYAVLRQARNGTVRSSAIRGQEIATAVRRLPTHVCHVTNGDAPGVAAVLEEAFPRVRRW